MSRFVCFYINASCITWALVSLYFSAVSVYKPICGPFMFALGHIGLYIVLIVLRKVKEFQIIVRSFTYNEIKCRVFLKYYKTNINLCLIETPYFILIKTIIEMQDVHNNWEFASL